MTELASEPKLVEGLPEGFKEGPFAFERNGKYYFTFPWVREKDGTETLAYAMADHPPSSSSRRTNLLSLYILPKST